MKVKNFFNGFLRQVPNILTLYRIAAAVAIMFLPAYGTAFYVVYALAGVSDFFDGIIARALKCGGRFGATADTIADIALTLAGTHVVVSNMEPVNYGVLAIVLVMFVSRAFGAVTALVRFKKFAMLHTVWNKIGLIAFFLIPFFYELTAAVGSEEILIYTITSFCILGAVEEVIIEAIIPEFDENVLSVVTVIARLKGKKKADSSETVDEENSSAEPIEGDAPDGRMGISEGREEVPHDGQS